MQGTGYFFSINLMRLVPESTWFYLPSLCCQKRQGSCMWLYLALLLVAYYATHDSDRYTRQIKHVPLLSQGRFLLLTYFYDLLTKINKKRTSELNITTKKRAFDWFYKQTLKKMVSNSLFCELMMPDRLLRSGCLFLCNCEFYCKAERIRWKK